MYAQVEKAKENKSKAVGNSVGQKKSGGNQGFGFVDNRPETAIHRKLSSIVKHNSDFSPLQKKELYSDNFQVTNEHGLFAPNIANFVLQAAGLKVNYSKGKWKITGRPGFRSFVLPKMVKKYNSDWDNEHLDIEELSLSEEALDQCHITAWAVIRGIVQSYVNDDMSESDFIYRTNALYGDETSTNEFGNMDAARDDVIESADESNIYLLCALLNSATPNLRLDDSKINRKIRAHPDPPLYWTPNETHLRMDSPDRQNIEANFDITNPLKWTSDEEHFLSSSVNEPVSPGRLTPRSKKAMDLEEDW